WQDLLAAAREVSKSPGVYGVGVSGKKFAELTEYVYYLYGNGGDFFVTNPDGSYGRCRVNDAAGVEALQFMVDLANKDKVTEPNVGENDRGTLQDLFLAGKLAMIETGPWFGGMIQERAKTMPFAVAPMPHNQGKPQHTLLVTDSIIVFKSAKNKDAVVKFLEYAYRDGPRLEFDKDFGMLPTEKAWPATPISRRISTGRSSSSSPRLSRGRSPPTGRRSRTSCGTPSPRRCSTPRAPRRRSTMH